MVGPNIIEVISHAVSSSSFSVAVSSPLFSPYLSEASCAQEEACDSAAWRESVAYRLSDVGGGPCFVKILTWQGPFLLGVASVYRVV